MYQNNTFWFLKTNEFRILLFSKNNTHLFVEDKPRPNNIPDDYYEKIIYWFESINARRKF